VSSSAPASPASPADLAEPAGNGISGGADARRTEGIVYVGAAVVVLIGTAFRFLARSDLWLDEALSANIAALPVGEMLDALRSDGHPPLFYLLLHGWMQLVGTSDTAVRALSGILAVATLPVAWVAGRRYAGPFGGLTALVLLAASPFAVRYANETRMYSLVMLLVFLGWLAVRRAMEAPTVARLAPVAVVSGLLLLTHYWSFYLLGTVGALALWRGIRAGGADDRRTGLRLVLAVAAGGVFFLPWLPAFLDQLRSTGTPWGTAARPAVMVFHIIRDYGGTLVGESDLVGFALVAMAIMAVLGRAGRGGRIELDMRPRRTTQPELLALVGTLAVAVVAGYATQSAFATRYSAMIFPLFLLLVSFGIALLPGRAGTVVLAGLAVAGLVASLVVVRTQRTQAGEVAAAIEANHDPGDLVVYCPDQLGPGVSRSLPPEMRGVTYPAREDPRFVNWVDYEERLDASDPAAFARAIEADVAADADIFLVWFGAYRTHDGTCEAIIEQLSTVRNAEQLVIASSEVFEPSSLYRYGPRTG
jgi:mannosyltransferase